MRDTVRQILRSPAMILSIVLCCGALTLGLTRDLLVILLGLVSLPLLFIVAIVRCTIYRDDPLGGNVKAWAPVLIALSPVILFGTGAVRDRITFAGWALTHPAILFADDQRDGIIRDWDSWGFAGSGNDSYLVADPYDAIGTPAGTAAWRRRHAQQCEIVDTQRMWPRLYIVTTYNCPLDGSYPA